MYGTVNSTTVEIEGVPISQFTNVLNAGANFAADFGASGGNALNWGVGLGSTVSPLTGAPLNPAVPYLYLAADSPASFSYGGMSLGSSATGASAGFNIVIDPADPMIYIDVKGFPLVEDLGVAMSQNDLLPYTPQYTPKDWSGQLYGDIFFKGELDLGDVTDNEVPVTLDGDMTINADPNHVGFMWSARNVATDLSNAFMTKSTSSFQRLGSDFSSMSFGMDGTVSLAFDKGPLQLTVPMGGASFIWNGQNETFYLHGTANQMNNNLPGMLHTSNSVTVDAMVDAQSGAFDFTLSSDYTVLGLDMNGSVEVTNAGFTLTAGLTFDSGWLGITGTGLEAKGTLDVTLGFDWKGDVTFRRLSGSLGVSYELGIFDGSWNGSFSYSDTVNIVTIGTSLWSDIESDVDDYFSNKFGL